MADLAKCAGKDCPQRETCRRFTAPAADTWQAWASWDADRKGANCDGYWPLRVADA